MSGITVYGIPGSPFLRTVEIVLNEKDVPYDLQVMAPGEQRSEEHLKRHPFGRIPAIDHDGFAIYETQAIIRYLDRIFIHPKLTPDTAVEQARMNQAIGIIECYFFPKAAAPIGFNRVIGPALLGITPNEAEIAAALPMAEKSIDAFEDLLGEKIYLTGDHASLADIMLGAQLDLFSFSEEGAKLLQGTRLETWLARMRSRPSFMATEPPALLRSATLAA
jgi:glutathione S-transferase